MKVGEKLNQEQIQALVTAAKPFVDTIHEMVAGFTPQISEYEAPQAELFYAIAYVLHSLGRYNYVMYGYEIEQVFDGIKSWLQSQPQVQGMVQ